MVRGSDKDYYNKKTTSVKIYLIKYHRIAGNMGEFIFSHFKISFWF